MSEITEFLDDKPPPGQTPWVVRRAAQPIAVLEYDPAWPTAYTKLAGRIRTALGTRVLDISHIGSTSVPGLPAKPIIDIDLIVADPTREREWLPQLESAGFTLTVREPWWHEHRCLKSSVSAANVHVFGPDSPELWKHRIFRDHLIGHPADRDLYAKTKRAASKHSNDLGETVMEYNHRKEEVIRDIYRRAFLAAGLIG